MTFKNRKARRAAGATGHRKSATGGRPMQAHHIAGGDACPPGAPCCEATEADRLFFLSNPLANTMMRRRVVGEFGPLEALLVRELGEDFRVFVSRLKDGHRIRQPMARTYAEAMTRVLDCFSERKGAGHA